TFASCGRSARSSGRNWNGRPGISKAVVSADVAGSSTGAAGVVTGAMLSAVAVPAEARRSPRPVKLRNRRLSIPGLRGRLHTSVRLSLRLPACGLFVAVLQCATPRLQLLDQLRLGIVRLLQGVRLLLKILPPRLQLLHLALARVCLLRLQQGGVAGRVGKGRGRQGKQHYCQHTTGTHTQSG